MKSIGKLALAETKPQDGVKLLIFLSTLSIHLFYDFSIFQLVMEVKSLCLERKLCCCCSVKLDGPRKLSALFL